MQTRIKINWLFVYFGVTPPAYLKIQSAEQKCVFHETFCQNKMP